MQNYKLTRNIPVTDGGYDLIVAGGGPAGSAGAIAAGRKGTKVLLIEAMGCLGGMGTSGLVTAFDPMADGEKRLVQGLMGEIVDDMYPRGFLQPDINPDTFNKNYHEWTPYSAEGFKLILDELTAQAGIDIRFFTQVIDVDVDSDKKTVRLWPDVAFAPPTKLWPPYVPLLWSWLWARRQVPQRPWRQNPVPQCRI